MAAAMLFPISSPGFSHWRIGRCDFQERNRSVKLKSSNAAHPIAAKNNGQLDGDRAGKDARDVLGGDPAACCSRCGSSGSVQCLTCSGTGLYVESILESQGIIAKVRCLGCGGAGRIMCPQCGGRCHA
ncbi:hypothetical protein SELMODRAFT_437654 [Selaginella moellendorffii]|uniref:Uncharacterized protein n=1 Tax=Selaginella moellendorffii TaxID=88036 RepID=D8QNN1_SELML|nr:uncharacterized protein LOC9632757 [Selaginella moellendorffii]EFJ38135.1 hypothetical protein SELMODRAFT_437654 [Selaginella moellendorffii]|eukprot:XP_002960596.1 uncharacterized protein LOC9632757 [Selaginella moellendorffii]